ncbi:MAG: LysE family translocator [Emcibacter sp.]|nr:LysE family translocator [Emcibacter sp.]
MTYLTILTVSSALFLAALIPGPGVFATLARALASGFSHSALLVAGIIVGDLTFLMLAVFGLSAMAELMGGFFTIVKYLGGAYLIWLGIKLWRAKPTTTNIQGIVEKSWKANFFSGLFITLGNPKPIFFYLGLLPAFVDINGLTLIDITILAAIIIIVLSIVLLSYAYTASKSRHLFKSDKAIQIMNRAAGSVMITTGGFIVAKP